MRIARILASLLAVVVGAGAMAQPAAAGGITDEVATFQVGPETYKIRLTDQDDIDTARALLKGAPHLIPVGLVNRKFSDVNDGWSWHIDPSTVAFSHSAIEVCDGLPSAVENHAITSDYYCPWNAIITSLEPATSPYTPK